MGAALSSHSPRTAFPPKRSTRLTRGRSRNSHSRRENEMKTKQIPEVSDGPEEKRFLDQQKRADETKERNKSVVRRFMEEFKNQRKLEVIDELFPPDCVAHLPIKGLPKGREAQK